VTLADCPSSAEGIPPIRACSTSDQLVSTLANIVKPGTAQCPSQTEAVGKRDASTRRETFGCTKSTLKA